jgi:hypothetical protein
MEGSLTIQERKAFVALKALGGSLSVIGSSLIIYIVLRQQTVRHSQRPTYHRFLLAMSVYDLLQAAWQAVGAAPVPRWTGGFGCFGTTETCTALGFFVTLALGGWIYNAGLSIYYVMVIRYGITESAVSKRFEPTVHVLAFVIPMILGISGLFLTVFNPILPGPEVGCFAWPYPASCLYDVPTCERGRYYGQWSWTFYAMQCTCVAIVMAMSILLYWTIRKQYRSSTRYASGESAQMRDRSRAVAWQAFLFALACFYANIWNILIVVTYTHGPDALFKFVLLNGLFGYPAQGFFNFLIYISPRYHRIRHRAPEYGRLKALYEVIFRYNEEDNRRGSSSSKMARRRSSLPQHSNVNITREKRASFSVAPPQQLVQEEKTSAVTVHFKSFVPRCASKTKVESQISPLPRHGVAASNESLILHCLGQPDSKNGQEGEITDETSGSSDDVSALVAENPPQTVP